MYVYFNSIITAINSEVIKVNYYLVALLDKDSYSCFEKIQKRLSLKYDLYDELPVLHITIEVIQDPQNLDKLRELIRKILANFTELCLNVNGTSCFEAPYKSVNLKVEDNKIFKNLIYEINYLLKKEGFKVRDNIDNWDLHISLANSNFSKRQWSDEEFKEACSLLSKGNIFRTIHISVIQLWCPVNDKTKMVLESYHLKKKKP